VPALEKIPPSISVVVQLYITGSLKESCSEVSLNPDSELYPTILQSPFVQVQQGRPNLKQLIANEIGEATGRMSINGLYFKFTNRILSVEPDFFIYLLVCGTNSLVNDTRAAIRSPRPMDILRGGPTISFHVENFVRSIIKNFKLAC
jgi:ferric-chelate reductase